MKSENLPKRVLSPSAGSVGDLRSGSLVIGLVLLVFGGSLVLVGSDQSVYARTLGEVFPGGITGAAYYTAEGLLLMVVGSLIGFVGLLLISSGFSAKRIP